MEGVQRTVSRGTVPHGKVACSWKIGKLGFHIQCENIGLWIAGSNLGRKQENIAMRGNIAGEAPGTRLPRIYLHNMKNSLVHTLKNPLYSSDSILRSGHC